MRIAVFCRLSGMPPNRAISGFLLSRTMLASKHTRGPCGVAILALCLAAIFDTVERCLLARVLSIDVSMTQRSRCSRCTSPAQQVVLNDAPVLGPELGDDGVVILVDDRVAACGFAACQVGGALR